MKTFKDTFLTNKWILKEKYTKPYFKYHNTVPIDPYNAMEAKRLIRLDIFTYNSADNYHEEIYSPYDRRILFNAFKTKELKIDISSIITHPSYSNTLCFDFYCGRSKKPFHCIMYKSTILKSKNFTDEVKLLVSLMED